jgi:hypothetical protein
MTIEQRLERLERAGRRPPMRSALTLAVLAAGVAVLMGQSRHDELRVVAAERLEVRDARGIVRAALTVTDDGACGLVLSDEAGKVRLSMIANQDHPSLALYDPQGTLRAELAVAAAGPPSLVLYDGQQTPRSRLTVANDGSTTLGLCDEAGSARLAIQVDGNQPELTMLDDNLIPRASLALSDAGAPRLALADPSGTPRVALASRLDAAGLTLSTPDQPTRAQLVVDHRGQPTLELYDSQSVRRAKLSVSDQRSPGSPGLLLYDHQENLRLAVKVLSDGSPVIESFHACGEISARTLRHPPATQPDNP